MIDKSPFAANRFEYRPRNLFYLQKVIFSQLEAPMPSFLVGTRGTGKTTMLKALNWKERIENEHLRQQLGPNPFPLPYIGVYIKLPSRPLENIDSWLKDRNPSLYGEILSLYLDVSSLELFSDAITSLQSKDFLSFSTAKEYDLVSDLIDEYPLLRTNFSKEVTRPTLRSLKRTFKYIRESIERAARLGFHELETMKLDAIPQIGQFAIDITKMFSKLISRSDNSEWYFKCCWDEGESLTSKQQIVVNTMIRLAEWPYFPVVAYVREPDDTVTTLFPKLTLQKADRNLIVIDDFSDDIFLDLANGVSTVRVREILKDPETSFKVSHILGEININKLLQSILESSVREEAKKWLADSKELCELPFFTSHDSSAIKMGEELPIYQTYLVTRLGLTLVTPGEAWERRGQESAELRKKMVAAYLSLCQELRTDVRYASAEMVLQMSDKCMRDFLLQMDAIFCRANKPLIQFIEYHVPVQVQDAALKQASHEKDEFLLKSGVRTPGSTRKFIQGVAQLTARLQNQSHDSRHLRSSERGIFEIDTQSGTSKSVDEILQVIVDASEAGFIRFVDREGTRWRFRVHTSLAATYQFSYRGAMYVTRIALNDIGKFIDSKDKEEVSKTVADIAARIDKEQPSSLTLFD